MCIGAAGVLVSVCHKECLFAVGVSSWGQGTGLRLYAALAPCEDVIVKMLKQHGKLRDLPWHLDEDHVLEAVVDNPENNKVRFEFGFDNTGAPAVRAIK